MSAMKGLTVSPETLRVISFTVEGTGLQRGQSDEGAAESSCWQASLLVWFRVGGGNAKLKNLECQLVEAKKHNKQTRKRKRLVPR